MSNRNFEYRVRRVDAKSVMDHHLQTLEGQNKATIILHKNVIESLLSSRPYLDCTESSLLRWMIADVRGRGNHSAAIRLQIVGRFIKLLCAHDLLPDNPLRQIKLRDAAPSWNLVVTILQSSKPNQQLCQLRRSNKKQDGPLCKYIQTYIDLQQSLGKKYSTHRYTLHELDAFLASKNIKRLNDTKTSHIKQWLDDMHCGKKLRLTKLHLVERYMDYLVAIGEIADNPARAATAEVGYVPKPQFRPFIFTKSQIQLLLKYAKHLPPTHLFKLRPHACYTMLVLLYALGLRSGEVCRLRYNDIDMYQDILHIKGTKFHKSRMVPFGPNVKKCLKEYLCVRCKILLPLKSDDPLFVAYRRKPIGSSTIGNLMRGIINQVLPNMFPRPRIHDLRHTFAVHRLLRWYREGADVQSKLPLLSAFMGHTEIRSTEVYLTITMDLLREANNRFYKHFGKELQI